MRRLRSSSIVSLLFAVALAATLPARAASDLTVTVTGTGASVDEARTDAVRQALQQTIRQLVVVDRVVSNDRLLRDDVMSTMNGYVERFRQTKLDKTATGFSVEAEITVSASRIENFIGIPAGGAAPLEGASLLAESGRQVAQRKARGEIFDRLFRDFPSETSDVKVLAIAPSTLDPNSLVVSFSHALKPTFLAALTGTLHALSSHECREIDRADRRFAGMSFQQLAAASVDDRWCMQRFDAKATDTHDTACIEFAASIRCYALEQGDYCAACGDYARYGGDRWDMRLVAFGIFVDGAGRSAMAGGGGCLAQLAEPQSAADRIDLYLARQGSRFVAALSAAETRWRITVPRAAADLDAARYFVMVPALLPPDSIIRHDVLAASNRPQQARQVLRDEAVLRLSGGGRREPCSGLEDVVHRALLSQ